MFGPSPGERFPDSTFRITPGAPARLVVLSVDAPEVQSAFRAGLGARFTFLSDSKRRWIERLGLRETTDTLHDPYQPAGFTLFPDLTIHRIYNGYWYWGRATMEELRRDMREITREIREDWESRRSDCVDFLCPVPPPPGPVIERYAGAPWPAGAFEAV